ncbi:MAG: S-adenosylmethionine:tRNA ribosyltransferase-isomerase [Bacteroidales bacterium]|jgi:S-adenosylmethionine:tRNA ribosyltransferase-isomerase|nr:S-adenosylmethionine:tRNA ribosyltransferase-isomerase [Bacteroidales bacterium]
MLHLSIEDYNYNLPDEKIALYPAPERDMSKLLVWDKGEISETIFKNIGQVLPEKALLVFNNTRVVPARMVFYNEQNARIEIFFLEPHEPKETVSFFASREKVTIKCLIGNKKRWKSDELKIEIPYNETAVLLTATLKENNGDTFLVDFSWNNSTVTFSQILELAGKIPLPPYINRETDSSDRERYQTVFARYDGSVAAPTAGLHFTDNLLENLDVEAAYLTLHVGAGTFKPVKTSNIDEHEMHAEKFSVNRIFLEQLRDALKENRPIISVGTTSMRTLESLYYLAKTIHNYDSRLEKVPHITQWMPYDGTPAIETPLQTVETLINYIDKNGTDNITARTSVMIAPSYCFHFANGIITNFHQPRSTLLLLIAAILKDEWHTVYNYALTHDFRFLSYGDSNLYLM